MKKVPAKFAAKVAAAKRRERGESRADEAKESKSYQRFERKYGVEKHK